MRLRTAEGGVMVKRLKMRLKTNKSANGFSNDRQAQSNRAIRDMIAKAKKIPSKKDGNRNDSNS